VLRQIAWREIFPWLLLLRSFRVATRARMLVLAAAAVLGTTAGWRIIGYAFSGSSDPLLATSDETTGPLLDIYGRWPWQWQWIDGARVTIAGGVRQVFQYPAEPVAQLQGLTRLAHLDTSFTVVAYLLLILLWGLLIWGVFGGAITRIAAVELAGEEQLRWGQVMGFARRKLPSYFAAPLLPLVGILLLVLPMLVVGLLLKLDFGVALVGIFWPILFIGGLIMAILVIGLLFGWPLMWGTISTEASDAFDALSRSYAYVFQRPLRYVWYVLFAAVLGLLGWLIVRIFAGAVVDLTAWGASWGSGGDRMQQIIKAADNGEGVYGFGTGAIHWWNNCVWTFAAAFVYSFFWVSFTGIYLLLRRDVDATELDEVHRDEEEEVYGLPPLETDAAGVPGVAEGPGPSSEAPGGPASTPPPDEQSPPGGTG